MFARLLSYEVRSDVFLQADLWLLLSGIGVLTTFIQACSLNRKRKAHKITCLYPLEIPDLKPPDTFGIPIVTTPPCLRNSSSKNPPLPSEFQKAVRRTVRIFSGIAQRAGGFSPARKKPSLSFVVILHLFLHAFLLVSIQNKISNSSVMKA